MVDEFPQGRCIVLRETFDRCPLVTSAAVAERQPQLPLPHLAVDTQPTAERSAVAARWAGALRGDAERRGLTRAGIELAEIVEYDTWLGKRGQRSALRVGAEIAQYAVAQPAVGNRA